jgi:hypothetical protein
MVETLSPDSYVAGTKDVAGLPVDAGTMYSNHAGSHKVP